MSIINYLLDCCSELANSVNQELYPLQGNKSFGVSLESDKLNLTSIFDVKGMGLLNVEVMNEKKSFSFRQATEDIALFSFCEKGKLFTPEEDTKNEEGINFTLNNNEFSGVLLSKNKSISFTAASNTTFSILAVSVEKLKVDYNFDLKQLIVPVAANNLKQFFHGKHNLSLESLIKNQPINKELDFSGYISAVGNIHAIFSAYLNVLTVMNGGPKVDTVKVSYYVRSVMERARSIIHSDLANYTTVKDLAKRCSINIITLQKGFKSCYGVTVNQYVQDLRMKTASELLVKTNLHISEIVYSLGLVNRSYFTKMFKQKYDYTPTEYRRLYGSTQLKKED